MISLYDHCSYAGNAFPRLLRKIARSTAVGQIAGTVRPGFTDYSEQAEKRDPVKTRRPRFGTKPEIAP